MLLLSRLIVEGERTGDDKFAQELLQRSGEIDGKVSGRTTRVREVLEVHRREQPYYYRKPTNRFCSMYDPRSQLQPLLKLLLVAIRVA